MPEFSRFVQEYFVMMDYITTSNHISVAVLDAIHKGNLTTDMCSGIPEDINGELVWFLRELIHLSTEDINTTECIAQAMHTLISAFSFVDVCTATGENSSCITPTSYF